MIKNRYRNIIETAALCGAIGLLLMGCGNGAVQNGSSNEKNTGGSQAQTEAVVKEVEVQAVAEYPTEPAFKDDDERWDYRQARREALTEDFIEAYEEFAIDTSAELLKVGEGNTVYSPLSLYYALAMAADGAKGETQEEMLDLLGYDDAKSLASDCKASFEALYYVPNEKNNKPNEWGEYSADSRYQLRIANSLWADDEITMKKEFAENAAKNYYADVFKGDLQSQEAAAKKSQWVSERTNGLITPSDEPADPMAVLSIINTIYFYDEWMNRFNKEETAEDVFTCADGTEVHCDFMNKISFSGGFRRGETYTASSLSLKNGQMIFVLPNEGVDVHDLVKDADTLEDVLVDGGESLFGKITWKVPKFSYGSELALGDMLKFLGMEKAFTSDAEFTAISDMKPLAISNIKQNARLGIDEDGVEGAAFTEILFAGAGLPKDEAEMILDRPFLYAVENNGQIVFTGICANPTAE